jgi:signal transduction histidine kinase
MAMTLATQPNYESDLTGAYQTLGIGTQRTHAVQFYEDDHFLIASVGDFLASGLAVGQRVLAVATALHRQALRQHLEHRGFDADRAMLRGQLMLADADELLAQFMVGDLPDPIRFRHVLDRVFRGLELFPSRGAVRVFGEMVDVLSRSGNVSGAIQLEALWNDLAERESFSLLCAYSMTTFGDGDHTANVASICGAHAHVIPTERYTQVEEDARLREIALLQQRAQALVAELEHRRALEASLREALARAEAASRAKSDFLAMMSHELRTPLNAIGGHVQLVELELHGPINQRQREALSRVQRSQRHLLALINDVLNLAQSESAQVKLAIERVPLAPLVHEVAELLAPLFAAGALSCQVAFDDEELAIRGDREKLHQILLNLLGNALKFTPAGGGVSVRVSRCPTSDSVACIEVADDGVGIPAGKLEEIFQPFVQLASRHGDQHQGIGLGLSISRALARGMDGDLTAASGPQRGATLTLTLPLA